MNLKIIMYLYKKLKVMKYYSLIKVHYDEWRHQESHFVSEDKDEVVNEYIKRRLKLPLYEYEKCSSLQDSLDEQEQDHFWLREFNY